MVTLTDYLNPNEEVFELLSPITYQNTDYYCAVTNLRILLFQTAQFRFLAMKHKNISSISLEESRSESYLYLICIIIGIISIALIPLLNIIAIAFASIALIFGIILIQQNQTTYFALIHSGNDVYVFFSYQNLLQKLVDVMREIADRRINAAKRPSIDAMIEPEPDLKSTEAETAKFCIHCAARIRSIAIYCDKCGKSQEPIEPDILTTISDDKKYCIYCGAPLQPLALFCDRCGKTLESPEPTTLSSENSGSPNKFCVFCGSISPLSANYCERCGKNHENTEPDVF